MFPIDWGQGMGFRPDGWPSNAGYYNNLADVFSISEIEEVFESIDNLPIDTPFLQQIVGHTDPIGKLTERHGAIFDSVGQYLLTRSRGVRDALIERKQRYARERNSSRNKKEEQDQYIESVDNDPSNYRTWTVFAKAKLWILLLFSIILLIVSIVTIQVYASSSNIQFLKDHEYLTYLFSSVPIGISIGLKGFSLTIASPKRRHIYHLLVWFTGIACGLLWAFLFSTRMVDLSQQDYAASDSSSYSAYISGAAKALVPFLEAWRNSGLWAAALDTIVGAIGESMSMETMIAFFQVVAECCVAAGCWFQVEALNRQHYTPENIPNPDYLHYEIRERDAINEIDKIDALIVKVEAVISAIPNKRAAYVIKSEGIYREIYGVMLMNARAIRIENFGEAAQWRQDIYNYDSYASAREYQANEPPVILPPAVEEVDQNVLSTSLDGERSQDDKPYEDGTVKTEG